MAEGDESKKVMTRWRRRPLSELLQKVLDPHRTSQHRPELRWNTCVAADGVASRIIRSFVSTQSLLLPPRVRTGNMKKETWWKCLSSDLNNAVAAALSRLGMKQSNQSSSCHFRKLTDSWWQSAEKSGPFQSHQLNTWTHLKSSHPHPGIQTSLLHTSRKQKLQTLARALQFVVKKNPHKIAKKKIFKCFQTVDLERSLTHFFP